MIKEEGHEGCGLFPDGFFGDILGKKNYDSIQVRHVGPKLGLAKGVCCCLYLVSSRQILVFLTIFSIDHVIKGMLLKKRGITRIMLPSSMIKAPPSQVCDDKWVAVVIKNVFPSEENRQHGRLLDPENAATNSWVARDDRKALSKMYQVSTS